MKKAVLVVAHGSRAKETERTFESVLDRVAQRLPDRTIEHAYMEFGKNSIEEAVESLVARSYLDITIIPYFLFRGIHLQEDIPELMEASRAKHPGLKLHLGETLGDDPRLSDILVDRIQG
ncbi:hypothetical protein ABB02_01909 [Clostridiaceae bacterium JG1575]|nr:hypothetical protein ABB02_01909 [Clostridiaceae bacterium JG1575]